MNARHGRRESPHYKAQDRVGLFETVGPCAQRRVPRATATARDALSIDQGLFFVIFVSGPVTTFENVTIAHLVGGVWPLQPLPSVHAHGTNVFWACTLDTWSCMLATLSHDCDSKHTYLYFIKKNNFYRVNCNTCASTYSQFSVQTSTRNSHPIILISLLFQACSPVFWSWYLPCKLYVQAECILTSYCMTYHSLQVQWRHYLSSSVNTTRLYMGTAENSYLVHNFARLRGLYTWNDGVCEREVLSYSSPWPPCLCT